MQNIKTFKKKSTNNLLFPSSLHSLGFDITAYPSLKKGNIPALLEKVNSNYSQTNTIMTLSLKRTLSIVILFFFAFSIFGQTTRTVGPASTGATYTDFELAIAAASDGDLIQLLPLSGGIIYDNNILNPPTTDPIILSGIEITIDGGGNTINASGFVGQAFIFTGTAAKTMKLQNITLCDFSGSSGAALRVEAGIGTPVEFENVIVTESHTNNYAVRFEGAVNWIGGSISNNVNGGLEVIRTSSATGYTINFTNTNIDCNQGPASCAGAGISVIDSGSSSQGIIFNMIGGSVSKNGLNAAGTASRGVCSGGGIYFNVGGGSKLSLDGTALVGNGGGGGNQGAAILHLDNQTGTHMPFEIKNAIFDGNLGGSGSTIEARHSTTSGTIDNTIFRNNSFNDTDATVVHSNNVYINQPNDSQQGVSPGSNPTTVTSPTSGSTFAISEFNFSGIDPGSCGGICNPNTIANIAAVISYDCLQQSKTLTSTQSGDWYAIQGSTVTSLGTGTTIVIPASFPLGYTVFWQDVSSGTDPIIGGTVVAGPGVDAGPDQSISIGSTATLAASPATGTWSIISGPDNSLSQFNNTTDPAATFTPTTQGDYVLQWSDGGACPDQIAISVVAPCNADAGSVPSDPLGCQELTNVAGGTTSLNLLSDGFNNTTDYTQVYFITAGNTGTDVLIEAVQVVGTGVTPVTVTSGLSTYTAGTYAVYVINFDNTDATAVSVINTLTTLPTTVADITAIATTYTSGACMVRAANEMIVEVCDPACGCDDGTNSGTLTTLTAVPGSYNPSYGQTYLLTNTAADPLILSIQESAVFTGLAAGNYMVYAINYSLTASENPFLNGASWTAITANTTTIGDLSTTPGLADACFGISTPINHTVASCPATNPITGTNSICIGSLDETYAVTNNNAGHTYAWSISGGGTLDATTGNSITVDWGTIAGTYTLTVVETETATGCNTTNTLAVTVNAEPVANPITGTSPICGGSLDETYAVTNNNAGHTYAWSISGGGTLDATTGNSITVDWGTTAGTYTLTVVETETATGCNTTNTLAVTVNAEPVANPITGTSPICGGSLDETYAVTNNNAGHTYAWSISGGGTLDATTGNSITVDWGATAGTYTLTIVETETATGCMTTNTLAVTVNAEPVANPITGTSPICGGSLDETYAVTNNNAGHTYAWSISGGGTLDATTGNSITVDWGATAGTYTLTVVETETATGCNTTNTLAVTVNAEPVANPITGTSPICGGSLDETYAVTNNNAGHTYAWSISGGGTLDATTGNSITVDWGATAGTYTLTVVETETATGCNTTNTLAVTVNAEPVANSITGTSPICGGSLDETYAVTNNNAGHTYAWSISGGGTLDAATGNSITVDWGAIAGTYTLTVVETETATGCNTTNTLAVTVNAEPVANSITGTSPICGGSLDETYAVTNNNAGHTYAWSISGGGTLDATTGNSITVDWGAIAGTYTLTVVETETATGCNTTNTLAVTVNAEPIANSITGTSPICGGSLDETYAVTNNNAGHTYAWSISGGGTLDATTGNSITVDWGATAGTYTLTVVETETATGCNTTNTLAVTVNAEPVANSITGTSPICGGSLDETYAVTNNNAGHTYAWSISGGGTLDAATGNSITVDWGAIAGTYTLTVVETETATGCNTTNTLAVTVNAEPVANSITGTSPICGGSLDETYAVTNNNAGHTYAWSISGGGTLDATTGNSITVDWGAIAGTYTLTVVETETATGCNTTNTLAVTVNAEPIANSITGTSPICGGSLDETYAVTNNNAGHTYAWSISGGGTLDATTGNSITVDWGATAGTYTLTVVETETATGCNTTNTLAVTVNAEPVANSITGTSPICGGSLDETYAVTNNNAGHTYAWSISGGGTLDATTGNSITVDWGAIAGTYTLTVVETETATGCNTTNTLAVTVNAEPVANPITGTSPICGGSLDETYAVTNNNAGHTYAWSISGGGTLDATTGNSITVDWGATAGTYTLTVVETETATGCNTTNTLAVTVNAEPVANSITGTSPICGGSLDETYAVTNNNAGHTYAWSISGGGTLDATTGNSITVDWGATAGTYTLTVVETETATGCNTTNTLAVTVNAEPVANPITGTSPICGGSLDETYAVTNNNAGHTYAWSISGGGTFRCSYW